MSDSFPWNMESRSFNQYINKFCTKPNSSYVTTSRNHESFFPPFFAYLKRICFSNVSYGHPRKCCVLENQNSNFWKWAIYIAFKFYNVYDSFFFFFFNLKSLRWKSHERCHSLWDQSQARLFRSVAVPQPEKQGKQPHRRHLWRWKMTHSIAAHVSVLWQ